jgi:hypothetical protein
VVRIINCTLTANTAQGGSCVQCPQNGGSVYGGAIFNLDGDVILKNATLARNTVTAGAGGRADGGAIFNLAYGHHIVTGGPVRATLRLINSILAATTGGSDLASNGINGRGPDTASITGTANDVQSDNLTNTSLGTYVITVIADPQLGPLQDNGGLTPTMALTKDSLAYGEGNILVVHTHDLPSTDQRGLPRVVNGRLDLGAFEVQNA